MSKEAPSPQAITGWKTKCDNLVGLEKDLAAAQAELEAKLNPIREAHEPDLEKRKAAIKTLKEDVVKFGTENAWHLFADGSQVKTKTSIITGKNGTESVVVDPGLTEAGTVDFLNCIRSMQKFLKVKKTLDRPAIKKALKNAGEKIRQNFADAGLSLGSKFSVTVKPKGD